MIVNGGGGKHRKPETTLHADWRFAKALGLTLSSMGVVGAIAFTVPKTTVAAVQADVEQPETVPAPLPELPYFVPPTRRHIEPVADVTPLRVFDAGDVARDVAKTEVRAQRHDSDKRDDHRASRDRDDHRDGGRHRADHQRRAYEGHGRWPGGGRHHRDDRDRDRDRGDRDHGDRDQRGHGHGDRSGGHHRGGGSGARSHGGHGGGHGGGHHGRG